MNRIPVKVVWIKDIKGNVHSSVMLAIEELTNAMPSTDFTSIKKFNSEYMGLITYCKELLTIGKVKNRIPANVYWQVGKNLVTFVETNETEYKFTNYRAAFQRDLNLTDSYIGIIMDFPKFFKEKEVLKTIPMSYYFELILKARSLEEKNLLNPEKERLIKLSNENKLPDHKIYRESLKSILSTK